MSQDKQNATKDEYCFAALPKNVRQVGDTMQGTRFFIEDYVMTFLHKSMEEKKEKGIVLFIGQEGEREAQDCIFIYGAVLAECNVLDGKRALDTQKWQEIYKTVQKHFPKGSLFGFGCGVGMWNSQVDQCIQAMQKENFPMENRLLFLADLGEKEEKVFVTKKEGLQELSGYWIYFSKNPQMQEYMLEIAPKKSFEGGYQDDVTQNIREVIQQKKEDYSGRKNMVYGMSCMLILLTVIGAVLLFWSTKRMQSMQQTIETLSNTSGNVVSESAIDMKKEEAAEEEITTPFFTPEPENKKEVDKTKKSAISKTAKPVQTDKQNKEKKAGQNAGYRVKAGDTLSQIVWRQYHTLECMAMVKNVNHIADDDKIKEGQYLLLPLYED